MAPTAARTAAATHAPTQAPTPLPSVATASSAPKVVPFAAQPGSGTQVGNLAPAGGPTLLTLAGTGSTSSKKFAAPASWAINFSYDCHNAPDNTNFQIFPTSDNPDAPVATVNEITETGSGTQRYTTPGTFYLVVNTLCQWKLNVTAG